MIALDLEQGSPEWLQARLGIPTASQFSRLITPKTMKPSTQSFDYLSELIAEWMLGKPLDAEENEWMQRGRELEPSAIDFYQLQRDVDVERCGFALLDDRSAGCSPDGLVGTEGGLEIKCPSPAKHVAYLLGQESMDKYTPQIQGCMWITGRQWWDRLSFHPELPPLLVRVERDEKFIATLAQIVTDFTGQLAEAKAKITAAGFEAPAPFEFVS